MFAAGPVSPERKARFSHHAVSHGLTTKDVYVPEPHKEEFDGWRLPAGR